MKIRTSIMPKKQSANAMTSDLNETEQDLVSHLRNGYRLETDSLGRDPQLHEGKEVIRPLSATRNTVKALEERGLIVSAKSDDPLRLVWRLQGGESRPKRKRKRRL